LSLQSVWGDPIMEENGAPGRGELLKAELGGVGSFMLRQTQGQRLQQKADPQLLLTNRILQMSSMELQQRIVQEIGENPALEQAEEYPCNRCDIPGPQCADCPYYHAQFQSHNSDRDDSRSMS